MSLTREELEVTFSQLEAELTRLELEEQPEEGLWEAFERLIQLPSIAIEQRDRVWWWEQPWKGTVLLS